MVSRSTKIDDTERLKVVTLEGKLTQWPLLQRVIVVEALDGEVLEAVFVINVVAEFFKH